MVLADGRLPFKLVLGDKERPSVTAYGGLPLIVECALALFSRKQWKALARALGYEKWQTVKRHVLSLVALQAAGGECVDDVNMLRGDPGFGELIGFEPSSASQLKDFLYRFHQAEDGRALTDEDDKQLTVTGRAQIRPEGPGLRVLAEFLRATTDLAQKQNPQRRATLDVDASIIEANKEQALHTYEGPRGYQPQMAWWAEQQMWICDEFRDGNVPAEFAGKEFLVKAFGRLPPSVVKRRLRGDTALYNEEALTWADRERIEFAVSADMSPELKEAVLALEPRAWTAYKHGDADDEREWAEVEFIPGWKMNRKKEGRPFRYLAVRVRSRQRDLLLPDAERWKHFAVVTNMDWDAARLLRWQREKQGTVEGGHDLVKNELGGGVLPCGRFCANAAWWRLNLLTGNLLRVLKVVALPAHMHPLMPKALRFRLFNIAGRLIRHGRALWLRIREVLPCAKIYANARRALQQLQVHGPAP